MVNIGKKGISDRILSILNVLLLSVFAMTAMIPLIVSISTSFSSKLAVDTNQVFLWPVEFTLDSWKYIVFRPDLWRSFSLTLASTLIGTVLALIVTALLAYPLAKKEFLLGRIIMAAVIVTMIFKAPIVPYFLTVREIGLFNNPLVLIVPHIVSAYCLAIMRTFFIQFPVELEEAAKMDGYGYFRILFRIVLPSSTAVLATLGLLYGVVIWNQYQTPLLFLQNQSLFPLQMKIKQFIVDGNEFPNILSQISVNYNERTLKSATVIFAVTPIILIYPYLQKYFVKGAMLGSVKG